MRVDAFLAAEPAALAHRLAHDAITSFRVNESQQLRAWAESVAALRAALAGWPEATAWELILEYPLRRLGRRIDAVLVTPKAVLVLEFKTGAQQAQLADRQQVEDYALDLQDFHPMSRRHPILPILITGDAVPRPTMWPMALPGVAGHVLECGAEGLGALLRGVWQALPEPAEPLAVGRWEAAPYRPVPGIIDAACTLYEQHDVSDIASARADARNLTATTDLLVAEVAAARRDGRHAILFVTGIPGAGKTLCGLNAVFGTAQGTGAAFLTGNPTLVHVLREALARNAADHGRDLRAARHRIKSTIQALPAFRDNHVGDGSHPPEHVVVIDEAQRAWSAAHAIVKSRDRSVRLTDSEPGHLLDIMARHADWAAIICLVGSGQEIHNGEGGLAGWGAALRSRPVWSIRIPPGLSGVEARQIFPPLTGASVHAELHLDVSLRSLRSAGGSAWVDAVLRSDADAAAAIARQEALAFAVTRDLGQMRRHVRASSRGWRRSGLLASSGARRLRADGLGVELPHMDPDAVAHWFLDRWPDVRASDALETVATEFSCQGLELDHVGLCWGGDLIRRRGGWVVRSFAGTAWQERRHGEAIGNRLNTYRVLLTRARYQTVIWVPAGDAQDATRSPAELDEVAAFLRRCGVPDLPDSAAAEIEQAPLLI